MFDWIELGNRLRALRMERGFSQSRLAALTGMTVAQLRSLEYGRKPMTVEQLVQLSQALQVSLDYLACGENDPLPFLPRHVWRLRERAPVPWWGRRKLRLIHPQGLSAQRPREADNE